MVGSDQINFTGTGFLAAGNDVSCVFQGVTGTVSSVSTTSAECSFAVGVPAGEAAIASIIFKDQATQVELTSDANMQTLTNSLSIGSGASGVSCSYAGGCTYTVSGNGLAGAIQSDMDNKITVCGNECSLDLNASTGSEAACTLPPLATSFSADAFDIVKANDIMTKWTGTGLDLNKLNDNINTKDS